jgi:hypothetical protein
LSYSGLRCVLGIVPNVRDAPAGTRPGVDCDGRKRVVPSGPRPKSVEVFACSGCRRRVQVGPEDEMPTRECGCGGWLVFVKSQSRKSAPTRAAAIDDASPAAAQLLDATPDEAAA